MALFAQVQALLSNQALLHQRTGQLEARLGLNSTNSSKPPAATACANRPPNPFVLLASAQAAAKKAIRAPPCVAAKRQTWQSNTKAPVPVAMSAP